MQMRDAAFGIAVLVVIACSDSGSDPTATPPATSNVEIPAAYKKFASTVQVTIDGDYVVLKSNNVPDHKSVYFATSDARYEAYNGSNSAFVKNPNSIISQNLTFRIPLTPAKNATASATPLGPIGIAVNGVALFNQYAGPNRPLGDEANSFDQYYGHPQQTGQYHYHVEPTYLTGKNGSSSLIGFLLDGFPVYGPIENGKRIINTDLDELHGHTGVTADYPNGIYHYHVTAEDPYINGAGFYGRAGTVTQ
jgi:hypothetical protein